MFPVLKCIPEIRCSLRGKKKILVFTHHLLILTWFSTTNKQTNNNKVYTYFTLIGFTIHLLISNFAFQQHQKLILYSEHHCLTIHLLIFNLFFFNNTQTKQLILALNIIFTHNLLILNLVFQKKALKTFIFFYFQLFSFILFFSLKIYG